MMEQQIFRLFFRFHIFTMLIFVVGYVLILSSRPPLIRIVPMITTLVLMLVVLSSWSRQQLGRFYLPIALTIATIAPLVEQQIILWRQIQRPNEIFMHPIIAGLVQSDATGSEINLLSGSWSPILFVPLIIIAWRYDRLRVVLFCAFTAFGEIFLAWLLNGYEPTLFFNLLSIIVSRTLAFGFVGSVVVELTAVEHGQKVALREANQRLMHFTATLEQLAVSRERNRLARELHDTLAHTLSASSVQLDASLALWQNNPAKAQELVTRTLTATRDGLRETRRVLEALRASPLEDLGLLLALRELVVEFTERNQWQLQLDLPSQILSLSPALEQIIYRCVQEAFANIERHAAATQVILKVTQDTTAINLEIQDNGRGFVPAAVDEAQHFGLRGLRERIEAAGGCLQVHSEPGKGTTLEMRL